MGLSKSDALMVTLVVAALTHTRAAPTTDISVTTVWMSEGCPPPELNVNGTELDSGPEFMEVAEIRFMGTLGPLQERRQCKIKCVDGQWVGPLCTDGEDSGRYQPLLRSCFLHINPSQLIISYHNVSLKSFAGVEFPHGTAVEARCRDLGLYKLLGNSVLHCHNGAWSSRVPTCVPTTQLTNFSGDSPPSIIFHIPTGSASVGSAGQLVVYPGSILHFDCLFLRTIGNPTWTWTSTFREYPTGWAISPEERNKRYRLSLYYAKAHDSGVYTCSTPRGLTNSISIDIKAVECSPLQFNDTRMSISQRGTVHLGHSASFACPLGFRLEGASNLTCLATGQWSSELPHCQEVRCPSLDPAPSPTLAVMEHNNSVGGRAVFACPKSHRLEGRPGVECGDDGSWSGSTPTCIAIECPGPMPPPHGRLVEDRKTFLSGEAAHFTCDDNYALVGEDTTICSDTGIWSGPTPFCKIACPSPGPLASGHLEPAKSLYLPGDNLLISCPIGLELLGPSHLLCMANGTWSGPLPECRGSHYQFQPQGNVKGEVRPTPEIDPDLKATDTHFPLEPID